MVCCPLKSRLLGTRSLTRNLQDMDLAWFLSGRARWGGFPLILTRADWLAGHKRSVHHLMLEAMCSSSPDQALRLPDLHALRAFTLYVDLNAVSDLCCYLQKPASNSTSKLAVPKPVNLPSLRKVRGMICTGSSVSFLAVLARLDNWHLDWCVFGEQENSGNDPNVKIVPASGSGWEKIEEPAPAPPALARESHWATTQARDSGWRPVEVQALPPPRPGSRRLNPHEFPSLSAATAPRQLPKHLVPSIHDSQVLVLLWLFAVLM